MRAAARAAGEGGSESGGGRCIGEPISWLRLERLALDELADAGAARAHLAQCPACAAAFARIAEDTRPLPALPAASAAPASSGPRTLEAGAEAGGGGRVPWWRRWQLLTGGGLATAAALAAVLLVVRARQVTVLSHPVLARNVMRVKGAGLVVVTLVRERDGAITFDPDDVLPGDRWKLQLTCDPGGGAWADIAVTQRGATSFPLPPQPVACGNAVVLPGAFRITGGAAELCVLVSDAPPDRSWVRYDMGAVCRPLSEP